MEERKFKKVRPLFTALITTRNLYPEDVTVDGIISEKREGTLMEEQTVLAVGDMVRNIKVGDIVHVNPKNYEVKKYDPNSIKDDMGLNKVITYRFNTLEMDGQPCLLLQDRDIDYIVEEYM